MKENTLKIDPSDWVGWVNEEAGLWCRTEYALCFDISHLHFAVQDFQKKKKKKGKKNTNHRTQNAIVQIQSEKYMLQK